jgi:hypothetical protein
MKHAVAGSIAHIVPTHHFDKPLNPILGETFQAEMVDGTKIFCEQTFHHPPISHIQYYGENNCYIYSGYTGFKAKAGLNSLTLEVMGYKSLTFLDGSMIKWNSHSDRFNNTLMGTMEHQLTGKTTVVDDKNNLTAVYEIGTGGWTAAQDYLSGTIFKTDSGEKVADINGNYMGFMDLDNERFFDGREIKEVEVVPCDNHLDSDSRNRSDSIQLLVPDIEAA